MTWADYLFWAAVAVALLYIGAWFHEVIEAVESRLLSFLPAREVAEPAARRAPRGVESGGDAGGSPGDGGNPGARLSARTDAAAPGAALNVPAQEPPRVDVTKPGIRVPTPGRPPWEIQTGSQPVLSVTALAALDPGRDTFAWMALPALPAVTGAPGGCTGTTQPLPALRAPSLAGYFSGRAERVSA